MSSVKSVVWGRPCLLAAITNKEGGRLYLDWRDYPLSASTKEYLSFMIARGTFYGLVCAPSQKFALFCALDRASFLLFAFLCALVCAPNLLLALQCALVWAPSLVFAIWCTLICAPFLVTVLSSAEVCAPFLVLALLCAHVCIKVLETLLRPK